MAIRCSKCKEPFRVVREEIHPFLCDKCKGEEIPCLCWMGCCPLHVPEVAK